MIVLSGGGYVVYPAVLIPRGTQQIQFCLDADSLNKSSKPWLGCKDEHTHTDVLYEY